MKNIKETFEQEYYPDDTIQFAVKDLKFALKVEKILSDIVLTKRTYTFSGISPFRKAFLNTLVFEHFKLDVCAYGKNAKNITDVFWKDGCRIPTMMVTEIASLVQKGVLSDTETHSTNIFKATVTVFNLQRSDTINDIKTFLADFKQQFYSERGQRDGQVNLHFFNEDEAKDVFTYFKNSNSNFANVELRTHSKEEQEEESKADEAGRKKKRKAEVDDEGFSVIN